MGVFNALATGASGLTAFGEAVRVIGDNIANVNTLGFKSQTINFGDVLGQTVSVSRSSIANQVGNGVRIGAITRNQSQGSVEGTTNSTDMAINGRGLFVLKDPDSAATQYSRAGAFFLDKGSNLINGQGFRLQGFSLDSAGNPVGNVVDITVANIAASAQATSNIDVGSNLDASVSAIEPAKIGFDPSNAASYHFKTDVNVFDALGAKHNVSTYFVKVGVDTNTPANAVWDWHAAVDGGDVKGGTAGTPVEIGPNIFNVANKTIAADALTAASSTSIVLAGTTATAPVTFTSGAALGDIKIKDQNGLVYSVPAAAGPPPVWPTTQDFGTWASNLPDDIDPTKKLSATGPYTIVTNTIITSTQTGFDVKSGNINTSPSVVAAGVVNPLSPQSLAFSTSTGGLATENTPKLSFPWTSASAGSISMNFGTPTSTSGNGKDGTIQVAGASATRFMTVDGFASGFLDKLETDSSGRINGVFTNGQRRKLFQVALAKFPNEGVLNKLGNNMLAETIASGAPVIGNPNNGGLGTIQPFALEKSNVDLANEFTKLIVIQRAYEANSKTILTTDQMLAALMTLKR